MRVLNWFIFCVWQFTAVQSSGLKLPLTSISCKTSPTSPKSLSLSFSPKDSIDSKINNIEDNSLKPIDTNPTSKHEVVKKTNSISKILSQLGLISDVDPKIIDNVSSNIKDSNLLKEGISTSTQNNLSNVQTVVGEQRIHEDEKNTVNYSIKVLSPPAVFNNKPIKLPPSPNKYKILYSSKKHPNSILETSSVLYPSKSSVKRKQEFIPIKHNVNCGIRYDGKDKSIKPELEKNINGEAIKLAQINCTQRNIEVETNIKERCFESNSGKPSSYPNVNTDALKYESSKQFHANNYKIPNNFIDVPLKSDVIPTAPDIINDKKEITSFSSPWHEKVFEYRKVNNNINSFNVKEDKKSHNYNVAPRNVYKKASPHISKPFYISGQFSPKLYTPIQMPELITPPKQVYNTDNIFNSRLSYSLDKIISFVTSKFLSTFSDNSNTNSFEKSPVLLTQSTTTEPTNLSEKMRILKDTRQSLSHIVPCGDEIESTGHLPSPQENIVVKDTTYNDSPAKLSTPYLSSVTINYMPCIESSNEVIIIV